MLNNPQIHIECYKIKVSHVCFASVPNLSHFCSKTSCFHIKADFETSAILRHRMTLLSITKSDTVICHTGWHCYLSQRVTLLSVTQGDTVNCHKEWHCYLSHSVTLLSVTQSDPVICYKEWHCYQCHTVWHCYLSHRVTLLSVTKSDTVICHKEWHCYQCHTGWHFYLSHRVTLLSVTQTKLFKVEGLSLFGMAYSGPCYLRPPPHLTNIPTF